MKKFNYYNHVLALALAGTLALTSCGDSKEEPDSPEKPVTPETPTQDKAMTPSEQKERMDAIAREFMSLTPASDFRSYANLSNYANDTYTDYDWSAVEDWADDCWEYARKATGNVTTKHEGIYGTYIYSDYTNLLLASNFTGHFRAKNGRWTKESGKADDLQFTFADQNGNTCVLKLETSGKVTKVYATNIYSYTDYYYDPDTYKWRDYYDVTQCTIGVPENVVVTLTQGGTQIVKTSVKVDIASLSGNDFDISKNSISASALIELDNGYKFNMSQVSYSGNQKASLSYSISKDGKSLATVSIAGDVSGIPQCNVEAFSRNNFDIDDYYTDNATAKNALVKIDILGKMQLQGIVSDVHKYADYLEKADGNNTNEKMYKQWLNSANDLTQISLFYDNTTVQQASMKLEAFVEDEWQGRTYWEAEPVLVFFDGSSNSMFDVFFNDTDFKSTIKAYESLIERYEDLFD